MTVKRRMGERAHRLKGIVCTNYGSFIRGKMTAGFLLTHAHGGECIFHRHAKAIESYNEDTTFL